MDLSKQPTKKLANLVMSGSRELGELPESFREDVVSFIKRVEVYAQAVASAKKKKSKGRPKKNATKK